MVLLPFEIGAYSLKKIAVFVCIPLRWGEAGVSQEVDACEVYRCVANCLSVGYLTDLEIYLAPRIDNTVAWYIACLCL